MSPEFIFWIALAAKMAVTIIFVLAATMTAERAGPLVGGLVATLPISAGPVYVFLALDHDALFIAASALATFALNMVNVIFALTYVVLAQRRSLIVSISGAMALWFPLALLVHSIEWSIWSVAIANVAVLGIGLYVARPMRQVPMPQVRANWRELTVRAVSVAVLVGVVVTFSFRIGPSASGILAVFPIVLVSIMYILHRRAGGPPSAAVLANAILGLVGLGLASVALHLTAVPLGVPLALTLALAISVSWSLLVLLARRHGVAV